MEFKKIKSSNLQEAAYDGNDKLQIKFPNGTYEYEGVKPEVYAEFEKTFDTEEQSSGKFFFQNIKPLKFKKL